jgi:uncharacterized protein YbjT (DUF2867 family)
VSDSIVAVAGATGALGGKIVARLAAAGVRTRALVRHLESHGAASAEAVEADVLEPSTLRQALEGVCCVVSTVTCFPRPGSGRLISRVDRDGNIALIDAAVAAGVERFVFVSFKTVPLDFALQRAKRAVEERLGRGDIEAVVLRPGKFMDVWFSPLCGFDRERSRATIFGNGARPVTWIAVDDVAEIAALAALEPGARGGTIELGGPDALSQREVVETYEGATGRGWSLDQVPARDLLRRLASADELEASLAALMLEAHLGSTTQMSEALKRFPVSLTTVSEFAEVACSRSAVEPDDGG